MRIKCLLTIVSVGLTAGCAGIVIQPKQTEYLDERTGITVGSLKEPVELIQSAENSARFFGKRVSFAYLGPVEWDRMGSITYALWVHIAPGNDKPIGDIRAPGAVTLMLDDNPVVLTAMDAPQLGNGPYQPVVSWGQTTYFELSLDVLKQLAAAQTLQLTFKAADDSTSVFSPSGSTHTVLTGFLHDRGITAD